MEQVLLFRNVATTTLYTNFYPVLEEYGEFDRCTRSEVCDRLGLSPGQSARIFHDGKLLKLWDAKLQLLSLGRQWLREIRLHGQPSQESLRQAALNVPLFALTWQALPDEKSSEKIFAHFRTITNARKQDLQSACKRYREAFFPDVPPTRRDEGPTGEQPLPRQADVVVLPRMAKLVAKYVQLRQEFARDEIAACLAYEDQVKEK